MKENILLKHRYLMWDSQFFKLKICRIDCEVTDEFLINKSVKNAFNMGYDIIYLLISDDIDNKNLFNKYFINQKVTFCKEIINNNLKISPRIYKYSDKYVEKELYDLSLQSGLYSRFNKDKNFTEKNFKGLYRIWIENSICKSYADAVFVYKNIDSIIGMITLKKVNEFGVVNLLSVDKKYRGLGIGRELLKTAEVYFNKSKFKYMKVDTQLDNEEACRFYYRNKFNTCKILNYYHIWKKDYEDTI